MRQVIDEFVLVPRGEAAERINGTMTLSETAAFIYEHLEAVKTSEEMADFWDGSIISAAKRCWRMYRKCWIFWKKMRQ